MLNVRIASLPPDRQTSSKDCRQCNKRRIKCDRSTPQCRKCTIRGFQCPGYQPVQLRWGQGGGGREHTTGRRSSVKLRGRSRGVDDPTARRQIALADSYTDSRSSIQSASREPCMRLFQPDADAHLLDGFSSTTISDTLFNHFNANVAPRLTWIDTPDHPWRKLMYPLAKRCTCLHLSILSVAAAHLSSTSTGTRPNSVEIQAINNRLREASLQTLNNMLRAELARFTSSDNTHHEPSSLVETLATTLVLCYGEMLVPDSTNWHLHLHACRILIERHQWRLRQTKTPDAATAFLMREVSDIEVFRTFGAFTRDPRSASTLPPRTMPDPHFGAFTGLLWDITTEERRRHRCLQEENPPAQTDMPVWRARLDHAYTRAAMDTACLSWTHGAETQKWMDAIVRAVYQSSLIYCYQALASTEEATETIDASRIALLTREIDIVTAGPVHNLSHDIFLPLFILGTEACSNENRQSEIEKLFLELVSATGLWCNYTALRFLRAFWANGNARFHGVGGWIRFAREHERDNGSFLVF